MYGSVELDASPILAYLEAQRARGVHATMTHVVGRALAVALAERPDLNVLIRRGRFYSREDVDIFFQIALHADSADSAALDLSGFVVRNADTKSVADLAAEFARRVDSVRQDTDPEMARVRRSLGRVPAPLLRPLHWVLDILQYGLNLRLPGVPRDSFGSAMVTNVGMFGLTSGYAPLFPPSHCPIVLLIGAVTRRPWVVSDEKGERVEVRPVLPLHATLDHRVLDGVQAARIAARIRELLASPDLLDPAADPGGAPPR